MRVVLHRLGDGPGWLRYPLLESGFTGFWDFPDKGKAASGGFGGMATVVFLGLHGDELAPAGYQGSQLAQLCIRQRAQRRVQGGAEVGQRVGVQLVGFGQASAGLGFPSLRWLLRLPGEAAVGSAPGPAGSGLRWCGRSARLGQGGRSQRFRRDWDTSMPMMDVGVVCVVMMEYTRKHYCSGLPRDGARRPG